MMKNVKNMVQNGHLWKIVAAICVMAMVLSGCGIGNLEEETTACTTGHENSAEQNVEVEPTVDLCQYCGKNVGEIGENGCFRFLGDTICSCCGNLVEGKTCHQCNGDWAEDEANDSPALDIWEDMSGDEMTEDELFTMLVISNRSDTVFYWQYSADNEAWQYIPLTGNVIEGNMTDDCGNAIPIRYADGNSELIGLCRYSGGIEGWHDEPCNGSVYIAVMSEEIENLYLRCVAVAGNEQVVSSSVRLHVSEDNQS